MEGERIGLFVDGADVLLAFGTGSVMQEGAAGAGVRINNSQCRLDYGSNHILKSRFVYFSCLEWVCSLCRMLRGDNGAIDAEVWDCLSGLLWARESRQLVEKLVVWVIKNRLSLRGSRWHRSRCDDFILRVRGAHVPSFRKKVSAE